MRQINYKCVMCGNPILSPDGRKRYCSDECALEADRARHRRYYYKHREECKARMKRYGRGYYAAHRDEIIARVTAYQARMKEEA